MKFLTEDEIVTHVISTLFSKDGAGGKAEIDHMKSIPREQMGMYHHGGGQYIRNEYNLWNKENPLTKPWFVARENKSEEYMEDGIDCHPCHPDAVSMNILYKIWDRVNGA